MMTFEDKMSLKIPAFLRGELSDEEMRELKALTASNPEFAADVEFQKQLKSAVRDTDNDFVPGEMGWAKLSKVMKEDATSSTESVTVAANDSGRVPKFWRYAAAILAVAAIGQAGIIGSMGIGEKAEPQYVTVSEIATTKNTVKISFADNVTLYQLTQNLLDLNGTIVSGPSALGLYAVSFQSLEACDKAVKSLETDSTIVESVSSCN